MLDESFSWTLWPDHEYKPPGGDPAGFVFEDPAAPVHDRVISDVSRARVFAYLPEKANGRAALVLSGGGYTKLVVGKEGVEIAEWLCSLGFHAFVLVHRFPCSRFGPEAPVDDAIEAMRQIRARAGEFGLEPLGIGVCGLSSGGHLAACLAIHRTPIEARPDFLIIGYAPISTNASGRTIIPDKAPLPPPEKQALYEAMQPDVQLADNPPPTFIVYAANDDVVPVENAYRLHKALLAKGAPAELHVFADAPHGFALREKQLPVSEWPNLCARWLGCESD